MQPRPISRTYRNTEENAGRLLSGPQVGQKPGLRFPKQPAREDRNPALLPPREGQEQDDEPEDLRRGELLQGAEARVDRKEPFRGAIRYLIK